MNVGILSESPADEAAVHILVEAALGQPVEPVSDRRKAGGVDAAIRAIPPALKSFHYRRLADALIVVVDSNDSPVHAGPPEVPCQARDKCRLCLIRRVIAETHRQLGPMPGYPPIRTAVGLAVPAIEAWYLCGRDPGISEATWAGALRSGRPSYTRLSLKRDVYGTDRPSLPLEQQRAVETMTRQKDALETLLAKFPVGFGCLLGDLRSWRVQSSAPT